MKQSIHSSPTFFYGSTTHFIRVYPDIAMRIFKDSVTEYTHLHESSKQAISDYVFYVPAHIHQEVPLVINTYISAAKKTVVIIDHGSSIRIHDTSDSYKPNIGETNRAIEYWVGDYAHLELLYDHELTLTEKSHLHMDCFVGIHGSLTINYLISGGCDSSALLNVHAQGEHSSIRVRGAYILSGNQQAGITIHQNHTTPHTQSDVIIKGVLTDNARAEYKGLISIATSAPHTDAVQENKNLLLGENCRAQSIPSLEILNNEVRCAHGSAVGQIDEDVLFYIQSRGVPIDQATLLLTQGFIAGLFDGELYTLACNRITKVLS